MTDSNSRKMVGGIGSICCPISCESDFSVEREIAAVEIVPSVLLHGILLVI